VVNRAALLHTIEPLIDPSPTQREALLKSLDKALVEASVALPLEAARRLASAAKDEFELVIRNLYVPKDMQRLAAKWEPSRTLDADFKESLREDLIDLLRDRRPQYTGPANITLQEAQADAAKYSKYIARSMPTKDAKKLLKAWARNLRPMPTARDQVVDHLLKLLRGGGPQAHAA
jgi:uncharacterized protein YdiU (UPF0061 family)